MIPGALLLIGIVCYWFFYRKTRDSLNPIGLFLVVWFITASISTLYLSPLQQEWNIEMFFVVISSAAAIAFAGYMIIPNQHSINSINIRVENNIEITNTFTILTRAIFLISLICVLIEWRYSGYILPGLDFSSNGLDKKTMVQGIPVIHYGSILMPYCGVYAYFELQYTREHRLYCMAVIGISLIFYSYMFSVSRGTILALLLSFVFLKHKKKPISVKKLIYITAIFLIVFITITLIRIPKGSLVFGAMGRTGELFEYISPIYSYIAFNFENLLKLIKADTSYTFFHYSLLPIWDILGLRGMLNIRIYDTEFFNARTYLYSFYHDLGIIGTIIYPLIIGVILASLYNKMNRDCRYILMLAVLQKAIIMSFFGNYFFGEFIMIWPYIVTGMVVLSLKYTVKY